MISDKALLLVCAVVVAAVVAFGWWVSDALVYLASTTDYVQP